MACVARPEVEERVIEECVIEECVIEEFVIEGRMIEERVIEFVCAQVSPGSKASTCFQYPHGSAVGTAELRIQLRFP